MWNIQIPIIEDNQDKIDSIADEVSKIVGVDLKSIYTNARIIGVSFAGKGFYIVGKNGLSEFKATSDSKNQNYKYRIEYQYGNGLKFDALFNSL